MEYQGLYEKVIVASAGGELTIDAFPPVQVLWMCCRAGAMGVILGGNS